MYERNNGRGRKRGDSEEEENERSNKKETAWKRKSTERIKM